MLPAAPYIRGQVMCPALQVSLRCATREFADGAARMGPRMLLQVSW